ncbi:MAG: hypothetical protein Q8O64_14835 [Sideroxyarcus sp.]|nr:hypothetical protein [Sideroxyarcus sp.]
MLDHLQKHNRQDDGIDKISRTVAGSKSGARRRAIQPESVAETLLRITPVAGEQEEPTGLRNG